MGFVWRRFTVSYRRFGTTYWSHLPRVKQSGDNCLIFEDGTDHHHHHHNHVHEGLGVFPVPWSSKWSWPLHLFLGRPMFLRPFGLYCSACFGILFVSILCTCCNHFFRYCIISFTMFCAPVSSRIRRFFSLSNFVIPSKCLKNFICAAFKRCSSLFFSTQTSLPNATDIVLEISTTDHQPKPWNLPEEPRPQIHRGKSLKSQKTVQIFSLSLQCNLAEDSILLGYDAVSVDNRITTMTRTPGHLETSGSDYPPKKRHIL